MGARPLLMGTLRSAGRVAVLLAVWTARAGSHTRQGLSTWVRTHGRPWADRSWQAARNQGIDWARIGWQWTRIESRQLAAGGWDWALTTALPAINWAWGWVSRQSARLARQGWDWLRNEGMPQGRTASIWAGLRLRAAARTGWRGAGLGLRRARPLAGQAAAELAHQLREAREVRPALRVLRDRRGRRLRASAFAHHRGAARWGGDMAGTIYVARGRRACTLGLTASFFAFGSFLGGSNAFVNYAAYLPDVHDLRTIPLPRDTLIFAADGTELADIHQPGLFHYEQPLGQMGTLLPEATVAIEDSNFWNESAGIDPQGIARAAMSDFQAGHTVQGASTITQQLVKLRLLKDFSVTYERKLKEAILAIRVQQTFAKQDILEMYLNSIHFGNQSLGAEAAAQNYFRKDTKDLDLAEASMLAGIPQSPLYNSPLTNWDVARVRQKKVLDAMVHRGLVTERQARAAYARDLRPELNYPPESIRGAVSFVSWTIEELMARYGKTTAYEGGLRVYTSLVPGLQTMAEDVVRHNVDINRGRNIQQGAMTAVDPKTGEVTAMVGSAYREAPGGEYNFAADVPRSPGSSFKIFTYSAGIESGKYSMTTPIQDVPITVDQPGQAPAYRPLNYDGSYHGTCELRMCMGNSFNIPAVQVELGTGIDQVVNMARKLGAPPYFPHDDGSETQDDLPSAFAAPLTLGGYGETPLQMATGAATIADMGLYHPATGIRTIKDSDGDVIYHYDPAKEGQQVMDPKVAYIMQTIMSDDNNRAQMFGRGSPLILPGRLVGAKTGTAEDFKDAWTVGYTPAVASAFWFGNPDYTPMQRGYDAVFATAPAWHAFMDQAVNAVHEDPGDWFTAPPGLVKGPGNVWLMPGTSDRQAAPPLPSWAHLGGAPAPKRR